MCYFAGSHFAYFRFTLVSTSHPLYVFLGTNNSTIALQATLAVYDFMEGSAGVGTTSSICKPALPLDDGDGFTLLKSWFKIMPKF